MIVGVGLALLWVFNDRVLTPFQSRRPIQKILKGKTDFDPRSLENPKYGSLITNVDCLRIQPGKGEPSELRWSEVEEVHAFKRDEFTTDLICLAFKKSGKDEYYEIHEEMAGYHDLVETLPTHLPGFNLEWFLAVAFPAFETNHQVIWKKTPND